MNRLDRAIIAGLVVVVAIAAIAIGVPALGPKPTGSASPSTPVTVVAYREGILGRPTSVNPFLAVGQIIVSIALVVAILLQARGTGLSGTFGGDSAVYRSRRGIERRLWQFTIVLLVLFVVFSLASFMFAPTTA